ncbi:hypothetical protein CAEBREN_05543 [Caenorhabditis brenneri]|uniref:Uncharacterized protein n=1 Tax=Caenorhabditis brenneri TaxID=135651 RepID=G0NCF2_CAEBE|nr:hypothetical protein CAEBREN_05543 [Caenorhabditis brenneri]
MIILPDDLASSALSHLFSCLLVPNVFFVTIPPIFQNQEGWELFLKTPDTAPAPVRAIMEYFSPPSSRKRPSSPRSMEAPPVKITRTEEVMDDEEDSDEDRDEIENHQVDEEVYDEEEEEVDSGEESERHESEGQESEGEEETAPEEAPMTEEEPKIVEKQDENVIKVPVAQYQEIDAPATETPATDSESPADDVAVVTPASNGETEEITQNKGENNNIVEQSISGHENGSSSAIETAQLISV